VTFELISLWFEQTDMHCVSQKYPLREVDISVVGLLQFHFGICLP